MLENVDLSAKVAKADYKKAKDPAFRRLAALQRRAVDLGVPVLVVFEGWDAAGKGTLINQLMHALDPRGFQVHSALAPNEEERLRPFLWRFWIRAPARGRFAIFDRSWYRRVLNDRVDGEVAGEDLARAFADIRAFERTLADDGAVLIKVLLHISRDEQNRRFRRLRKDPATAWRVTDEDLAHHRQYKAYLSAYEAMLTETDAPHAPWTVVEAQDHRHATLKILRTVVAALQRRLRAAGRTPTAPAAPKPAAPEPAPAEPSILDRVDLTLSLEEDAYRRRLKRGQKRLRELEHEIYVQRVPVVLVFQGWDAAGKGGTIRRLTQDLDPRGYHVVPVGPPNDAEKARHYLWRFWTEMPKAGHITLFDRSWYGRVLVERVEGFCTEAEWRRAYREINEMEQHLLNFGTVLLKFWLHIDRQEQLRRFRQRQRVPYKRWKIGAEDWRNRSKWDDYEPATEEMLRRTSPPNAPWTLVEANSKWFARVKVIETVCSAIERRLHHSK